MRRFHRWFGLIVAVFLAVISASGVILQVQVLAEEHKDAPVVAGAPPQQAPDESVEARSNSLAQGAKEHAGPPDKEGGDLHETIMHIHSGEYFGKFANVIGLLCGLALFFFSVSGMWMYWQMFSARAKSGRHGIFWK